MTFSEIAQAIARYEGFGASAGNRPTRNNNPGNLMFAGQAGATGKDAQGFAIFGSPEAGMTALERQIALDASRGHTLESFLHKYAPASENNTSRYLATIAGWLGIADPQTPLTALTTGSPSANPWTAANAQQAPAFAAGPVEPGGIDPQTLAAIIVGVAAAFTLL